jgi:hypothetical protein
MRIKDLPLLTSSRVNRALPSLAALAYPGLIWCGTAIGPVFLAISLLAPLAGLLMVYALDPKLYPRSRAIAFAGVGAPPLYTLLGGWLDFQHLLPFKGLHVWIFVWLAGACIAFLEQPSRRMAEDLRVARSGSLPLAHGISAAVITFFAAFHLANHFGGLWGEERHTAILHALRLAYRQPIIETILLGSIAFQVFSGWRLLRRKLPRAVDGIDILQVASAIYLLIFFFSHLSAVLRARFLRHVDTNWIWLTDGLLTDPWSARLVPYYFLAVVAFGIHGAAGVHTVMLKHGRSVQQAEQMFYTVTAGAAMLSASILAGLIRG